MLNEDMAKPCLDAAVSDACSDIGIDPIGPTTLGLDVHGELLNHSDPGQD